eukprot:1088577-Amorphochlora_amoeboformis.AAC.1
MSIQPPAHMLHVSTKGLGGCTESSSSRAFHPLPSGSLPPSPPSGATSGFALLVELAAVPNGATYICSRIVLRVDRYMECRKT